jgi:hypothetical protein
MQKRINGCVFRYVLTATLLVQLEGCAALQEPAHDPELSALRSQTEHLARATVEAFAGLVHTRESAETVSPPGPSASVEDADAAAAAPAVPSRTNAFSAIAFSPKAQARPPAYKLKLKLNRQAIAAAYVYHADRFEARHDERAAISALRASLAL